MADGLPYLPGAVDGEEAGVETRLRPRRLAEFIGQGRVVDNLCLAIGGAKARQEALDHALLCGMPGLGKTTLANVIAEEMGARLHVTSGPVLERGKDVVGLLTDLRRGDVLFIDEIHRMSAQAEEYLYSAMEDFAVDILVDRGPDARSYRVSLEPFTLVGATTREGLLSAPLRGRFGIVERLEPYPPHELDRIVQRSAKLLGCAIDPEASLDLASRCRGTPRYANRFLRRIRDVAQFRTSAQGAVIQGAVIQGAVIQGAVIQGAVAGPRAGTSGRAEPLHVDCDCVREGLERLGVDDHGLDRVDRKILEVLLANGEQPVGVKTLAVCVGEEERTIEDVYEPFLIREGLVVKTARGRRATARTASLYGQLSGVAEQP